MALRAVLFDLGDTLIDSGPIDPWQYLHDGAASVHGWLTEHKQSVPELGVYERRLRRAIGRAYLWSRIRQREVDVYDMLDRLHRRWSIELSREEVRRVVEIFYRPLRVLGRVRETTFNILEELRQGGLKLGMVSNTIMPGDLLDDQLAEWNLLGLFAVRIYSSDVGYMKPDERILRAALEALGVVGEETMFVGDTPGVDIRGANRMGMISVWRRSFQPADRRFPARYEIRELTELPELARRYLLA